MGSLLPIFYQQRERFMSNKDPLNKLNSKVPEHFQADIAELVEEKEVVEELPKQPKRLSFEDIRNAATQEDLDLWDCELSYADNFKNIFNKAIAIPERDLQLPIIQCFASLPSALCHYAPILCLYGRAGTGKSQTAILLSKIWKTKVFAASTTFAGIRNELKRLRWVDKERERDELNCCLFFDNINANTLRNAASENLYTFFLSGYCRATDAMPISRGDGTNIDFHVFSPKVITTIHPLFTNPILSEIKRRMIVLKFLHLPKINEEDKRDFDADEILEVEQADLTCLSEAYWHMWNDEHNQRSFIDFYKETGKRSKFVSSKKMTADLYKMCRELIVAGHISGAFSSLQEGITLFSEYWDWYEGNVASQIGALQKAVKDYISHEEAYVWRMKNEANIIVPLELNSDKFYSHITTLSRSGVFETRINPELITQVMNSLGFFQTNLTSTGQWCWVRTD